MNPAPLLAGFGRCATAGYVRGEPLTVEAFLCSARTLADKLPAARCALLLCQDRLNFAIAFTALIQRGTTALLPPSHARLALVDIVEKRRPAFALVDRRGIADGVQEIVVQPGPPHGVASDVPSISGEHVAAVVYTSGTTGEPQAHEKRWASLVRGALELGSRVGFAPGDAIVGAVPPQHMWGLEATIMLPLQNGGSIHPGTPLLPQDIAAQLASVASRRWLVLTPLHARACIRATVSLPPLGGVLCATSPLDRDIASALERLSGVPAIEIYGSTETGAIGTRRPAYDDRFTPLGGVSVRQTAAGLEVRGGHVGDTMLGDRADVGRDGSFALLGRDADQVKVGGKRASLSMLNATLRAIPGVVDAEYVQCEVGGMVPRLAALAVAPGVHRESILAALRERVDPVFLPRPLQLVDALPRDAIGKIAQAAIARCVGELSARQDSDELDAT